MMMKRVILLILGVFLFVQPVLADPLVEVDLFLRKQLDTIMLSMQDKNLSRDERHKKILVVVDRSFDFKTMAKLSLGRKYWPALSKTEKLKFTALFVERMKSSYLEKLDLYEDEKIVYKKPEAVKKKVKMMTELVSADTKFKILYKLYKSRKSGWLIYDIELEGVSLITTYRSQFKEVLQHGTMADLFVKLERPEAP